MGRQYAGTLCGLSLPLSGPILAVMVLFYAVGHWNSYFSALIYLSDRANYPMRLFLREILVQDRCRRWWISAMIHWREV